MTGKIKFAGLILGFLLLVIPVISDGASMKKPPKRLHADVLQVRVQKTGAGEFIFSATISSPDTGWKKYANAFRVRSEKGKVFGTRVLFHPHVNEQPFTRYLSNVKIPPEVHEVIIDARDSVAGWGGKFVRVKVPH
jgi:hypothetical protein